MSRSKIVKDRASAPCYQKMYTTPLIFNIYVIDDTTDEEDKLFIREKKKFNRAGGKRILC